MSHILQVEHLSKHYTKRIRGKKNLVVAVNDVSFTISANEKLGIIGVSGCGKTTLLKLILGLIKPTSGTVIKNATAGFVAQDPYASLCRAMTVEEIIAEPLIFCGEQRKVSQCRNQVKEAMEWVRLGYEKYSQRYPHQLSGGERQRVSVARALIRRPGFMAMDEPTSMVDQEVKADIMGIILSASEAAGSALLLVTHDIAFARDMCKTIFIMNAGSIIERASSKDLVERPTQEYTKRLIMAATDLKGYWAEL